jgi:D-galactose 1-dehydrogenase
LIGFGEIARNRHVPTILARSDFTLACVADPHGDFSGLGVPAFRSHTDMFLALPDLDAVAICTPPGARTRAALDAIAAGKHVLLEKPPAASMAEFFLMRDAAAAAGLVLFTAWHSQHNEAVARAKILLAHETVTRVGLVWKENVEKYHPGQQWIFRPGGFGVFDAGINGVSILTRILPQRPFVRDADLFVAAGDETPIAARIEFGIGAIPEASGAADLDWRHEGAEIRELSVTTRGGKVLRLAASGGRLVLDGDVVVDAPRREYPDLYDHFSRLLDSGESDVDGHPLALVADALALGRRRAVAARPG